MSSAEPLLASHHTQDPKGVRTYSLPETFGACVFVPGGIQNKEAITNALNATLTHQNETRYNGKGNNGHIELDAG